MRSLLSLLSLAIVLGATASAEDVSPEARKSEYIHAVTRGAGLMPWQDRGVSEPEKTFRARIEQRKDELLAYSRSVRHPVLYTQEDLSRARQNAEASDWARSWVSNQVTLADYVLDQPDGWIETMIPEETPAHGYGFTCPNCVGEQSQEAVGYPLAGWFHRDPEVIACRACGQRYPDPAFPETAELVMPRMNQRVTYYLNDTERAHPDDRTGKLAWHWVGYPIHVSFTGLIREKKIGFMRNAAQSLAFAYAFTDDVRYAVAARDLLVRYAHCYRNWLYRDYWDTYADCDPMYAAWHYKELPIEWKRHLCEQSYAKDTLDRAAMLQSYWGAGRVHPSTDSVSGLSALAMAYDLTCEALREDGAPVWSEADRTLVERDLLLEYIIGAEPFVGGAGKADNANNKAPRVYNAMASVAKCLGMPSMADTALRGYERVRDNSFNYDGFSTESPSYNNMYLSQLLLIPETLHGFSWTDSSTGRKSVVDYYATDPKLRLMYRGILWTLLPSGRYLPLSDTHVHSPPSSHMVHIGLRRYPDLFSGTLPAVSASNMSEYALFHLSEDVLRADTGLNLPETHFPAWQTAVLRHGRGPDGTTLTLAFNPSGGHRHQDNLAVFYEDGGRALLGDHGYVGDMPINNWIRSTSSHNVVVVDDQEQRHKGRKPEFVLMATSALASVVEASSDAYAQCSEYRRRLVLVKGPDGHSFAVDIFRVAGGTKHAFRTYSECAASDTADGGLRFEGLTMPEEPPLPDVGSSLARADIFGLRDVRTAVPQDAVWNGTWYDSKTAYRLWMLTACDRVEASNGPGQRSREDPGRRVRYVDAVRSGESLESTFVALHAAGVDAAAIPVTGVERLRVPGVGERAVALRVESTFGTFYVLNKFEAALDVDGIRFQGELAVLQFEEGNLQQYMAVAATELTWQGEGFENAVACVEGTVKGNTAERLNPQRPPESGWPSIDADAQAYVRVLTNTGWTGFPVDSVDSDGIRVKDYPLPEAEAFELPSVRYATVGQSS